MMHYKISRLIKSRIYDQNHVNKNSILELIVDKIKSLTRTNSKLSKSIFTAIIAKILNIGSALITIPITINYLGVEKFGVWMAVSGFVGFMSFADFGLGIGLQNALSRCKGENDKLTPRHYISNTYLAITTISLMLMLIMFSIKEYSSFSGLVKIEDESLKPIINNTFFYVFLSFIIGMPINLIQRILDGYQQNYSTNCLMIIGRLLGLGAIFFSVYYDLGLIFLSVSFAISSTIVFLIYSVTFFIKNKELKPRLNHVSKNHFNILLVNGSWSLLAQIAYLIKANGPILIISSVLGANALAPFSTVHKLTGVISAIIGVALQPLWPVYGEAYFKKDKRLLTTMLNKSLKMTLVTSIPFILTLIIFGKQIIEHWTDNSEMQISTSLIVICGIWALITNINVCYAMLLNGSHHLRGQATHGLILIVIACIIGYKFGTYWGSFGVIASIVGIAELLRMFLFRIETKKVINGTMDKQQ